MNPLVLRELGPVVRETPVAEVPAALCGPFAAVPQGLYVFVFNNTCDLHVFDNNKKRKVVIHGQGASIKPGKFEQGFELRMHNYNAHLHRTPTGSSPEWVLRDCFTNGYLLDLSELVPSFRAPARIFERYWNEAVNAYLERHRLLADRPIVQLGRAEWRYLHHDRWTSATDAHFREYLASIAERIFKMASVGALPPP